jgi:hypothetical protein
MVVICNNQCNFTCLASKEVIVACFSLVVVIYMLQIVIFLGRYKNHLTTSLYVLDLDLDLTNK